MKLNQKIKKLLIKLLENEVTVLSWGISNIQVSICNLSFEVNGFKYKGNVQITIENKGYRLILKEKNIICSLDNIVSIMDNEIEKNENYMSNILATIPLLAPTYIVKGWQKTVKVRL